MTFYCVEYYWGEDKWQVDSTFNDVESAQRYIDHQVTQTQSHISGSLDGYGPDDFRIVKKGE